MSAATRPGSVPTTTNVNIRIIDIRFIGRDRDLAGTVALPHGPAPSRPRCR